MLRKRLSFLAPACLSALVLVLAACGGGTPSDPRGESADSSNLPLVARTAGIGDVNTLVKDPARDPLPDNPREAEQVRLGYKIITDTRRYAGQYVGNSLSCGNCHLNAGQRDRGLPYVGIAGTFPQYRGRDDRLISLEDRISDCFRRSMNGTSPPFDSPEMMAVAAYITWLSAGIPVGESPAWRGQNRIAEENLIPIERLDVARGEQIYLQQCTACHGTGGEGLEISGVKPGPLWGPESWNDGAGASRIYTLAGYIRYAMPLTLPGMLSDEEAQHVAAFINAHERPAYAHKRDDYPGGDVPIDAVYYPQRYARNPLMR